MVSRIFLPHSLHRDPAKRHVVLGIRLTWTDPVETLAAPQPQQIAFAPAVTPGTFTEEPSSFGSAGPSPSLFPSNLDGAGPKRPGHGKKKGDDHIPRPPNAFILFRSSFIKSRHVSTQVETNHSTLSKIIGLTWQNMPHEERQFWHSKAKVAQAEHKRKFPDYAFRPSHVKSKGGAGGGGGGGGTNSEKRKVREVGPKDMKRCAKIAQLLIEGKKGEDLQAAVQEFDKNHVPTVVTRFDTPITARSFRRSLSEPAPDTDPSAPAFLRPDTKPSSRRLRATSSQPNMSRPSTPRMEESFLSSASSPSVDLAANADALSEATWSDMPPLVLPPAGPVDTSLVSKHAPSLVSVTYFVFTGCGDRCWSSSRTSTHSFSMNRRQHALSHLLTPLALQTLSSMVHSTERVRLAHLHRDPSHHPLRSTCPSWSPGRRHHSPVHLVLQSVTPQDLFLRLWRRCRHRLPPCSIHIIWWPSSIRVAQPALTATKGQRYIPKDWRVI